MKLKIKRPDKTEYSFFELLSLASNGSPLFRLFYAGILPVALIGVIINYHALMFNWLIHISFVAQICLALAILIVAVFPYAIGTGIYGHVLLPYIAFIITGKIGTYTYRGSRPSIMVLNDQLFYRVNHGWMGVDNYARRILAERNISVTQASI